MTASANSFSSLKAYGLWSIAWRCHSVGKKQGRARFQILPIRNRVNGMGTSQFLFSSGWSVKSLRDTMTSWSVCESAFPPNLHLSSSSLALKSLGCHLWKKTPPETYGAKGNSLPTPGEMGLFCFSCHQPRFVQTSQAFSVDHVSTQGWEPHSPTRSKTSRIYNLPLLTAGIERIHIKYIYIYIHIYFLNNHIISKVHQPYFVHESTIPT